MQFERNMVMSSGQSYPNSKIIITVLWDRSHKIMYPLNVSKRWYVLNR